MADSFSI